MFQFMAHHQRELDALCSTRDDARSELSRFSDALLYRGAMAALPPGAIVRGEEDVVHTESARRAGEALRKVVDGLHPEQRRLLETCGAYGTPVAEVAREQNRRYMTVLYAYHDALALCGARLGGLLGTREAPVWDPDRCGTRTSRGRCSRSRRSRAATGDSGAASTRPAPRLPACRVEYSPSNQYGDGAALPSSVFSMRSFKIVWAPHEYKMESRSPRRPLAHAGVVGLRSDS
jgi:hypothetical protein